MKTLNFLEGMMGSMDSMESIGNDAASISSAKVTTVDNASTTDQT